MRSARGGLGISGRGGVRFPREASIAEPVDGESESDLAQRF